MLAYEKLENFQRKAIALYNANKGLKYSFTHFEGVYNQMTYYMVSHVLAEYKLNFLENVVMTLLRECISNGVKANLKRLFFERNNADINDQKIYDELITKFKEDCVSRVEDFTEELKKKDYQVLVLIDNRDDNIRFTIENNAAMNADELERVRTRIDAAAKMTSMADAFDAFSDEQEGAGLGLLITMMMLKKSGIGSENFRIASNDNKTRVSLTVPKNLRKPEFLDVLFNKITMQIDNIPSFPDSINNVIKLCDDPDSDTAKISNAIEKDPSLTSSIVRMANSNSFSLGRKVIDIKQAMTIIGIKNVRDLALAVSSREILTHQFKIMEGFWKHAERCAGYSRLIAKELNHPKIADSVYLGGLLHDLGKIILTSIDPDIIKSIYGINTNRKDSSAILEEISLGVSHAVVGAELASYWNFPDSIINIIEHHHSVFASAEANILEVSIVHIADCFLQKENRKQSYIFVDETAKSRLGLDTNAALDSLHAKVKNIYEIDAQD